MLARKSSALVCALALTAAAGASAASHPHLFFSSADVAGLRAQKTGAKADIANAILAAANAHLADATPTPSTYSDQRQLGSVPAVFAFAYVLTGDTRYSNKARALLLAYRAWDWTFGDTMQPDLIVSHMLLGAACAYDWIYPVLSASDRTAIAAKIGTEANRVATNWGQAWWVTQTVQNHDWINVSGLGIAALVLEGEDTRTAAWLKLAEGELVKISQSLGMISDGSFHEGVPYQAYGLSLALPFWDALARAHVDYTDMGMLRGLGKFRLAMAANDNPRTDVAPMGDFYGWSQDQTVQVLRWTANRFNDRLAETAARRWLAAGHRTTDLPSLRYEVFEYLAYDPAVTPVDVNTLPLDASLADLQTSVLRSSWAPAALTLTFKSAPYGGRANFERLKNGGYGHIAWGHDHNDDMSFWLYEGGWLAPETAGYDAAVNTNYTYKANQTVYHNSILVDGKGELGDTRDKPVSESAYPWFFSRDTSPLLAGTGTAHYSVAAASGPRLFDASAGLSKWDRVVLLARDRYAVIHDDLAASSTRVFDWLCHFPDAAHSDPASGWVQGTAANGRVLGVRVVAPVSWSGSTSTQTAQSLSKIEADNSIGLVKVRPTSAHPQQQFLAVLFPTTTVAWATRPSITPLSSEEGAGAVVNSAGVALQEKWIFGHAGSTSARSGGNLTLSSSLVGIAAYAGTLLSRTFLAGAGALSDQGGARLLLSSASAKAIEAEFAGAVLMVSGSGINDFRAYGPGVTTVKLNGATVPFTKSGNLVVFAR